MVLVTCMSCMGECKVMCVEFELCVSCSNVTFTQKYVSSQVAIMRRLNTVWRVRVDWPIDINCLWSVGVALHTSGV